GTSEAGSAAHRDGERGARRGGARMIPPDVDRIPADLKTRDQWVVWRSEMRNGKATKVPYYDVYHHVRYRASSTKPITWMAYADASTTFVDGLHGFRRGAGAHVSADHYDGLGFMLSADDPYTVVDLD